MLREVDRGREYRRGSPWWARFGTVAAGMWLALGSFLLPLEQQIARSNDFWVGWVLTLTALGSLRLPGSRWAAALLGVWLTVAPVVLGYGISFALYNDMAVGILVVLLVLIPNAEYTQTERPNRLPNPR